MLLLWETITHRFFHSMEPFLIVTLIYCLSGYFFTNYPMIFTFVAEPAKLPSKKKGGMQKVGDEKRASCRSCKLSAATVGLGMLDLGPQINRGSQVKAPHRHFCSPLKMKVSPVTSTGWGIPSCIYGAYRHGWFYFCGHGASHHFSRQLNQSKTPRKQKRNSKKWSNGSQRLKPSCWANKKT